MRLKSLLSTVVLLLALYFVLTNVVVYMLPPYFFLKALQESDDKKISALVTKDATFEAFIAQLGTFTLYEIDKFKLGFVTERNKVPATIFVTNKLTGKAREIKLLFTVQPGDILQLELGTIEKIQIIEGE